MTKRVFFLGAGFSHALSSDFPLMTELTKNIANRCEKGSISQHYLEITDTLKSNVEHLLTFLSTDLPWKTEAQIGTDKALYYDITKQIQHRLLELQTSKCNDNKIVSDFFDFIYKNYEDNNFITLNYDLLLENLIVDAVERAKSGIYVNIANMYSYPMMWIGMRNFDGVGYMGGVEEKKLPQIIKLHGSINWYWGAISASEIIYYISQYDIAKRDPVELQLFTSGLSPYIIPPVMDKNAFYTHIMIRHLWKKAKDILQDADEIYIIGFSMPQSDLSVRFLFQSALEKSKAKIFVVNNQNEQELRKKYDSVTKNIVYKYAGNDNVVLTMMQDIFGVTN